MLMARRLLSRADPRVAAVSLASSRATGLSLHARRFASAETCCARQDLEELVAARYIIIMRLSALI